jgi:MFS family permease
MVLTPFPESPVPAKTSKRKQKQRSPVSSVSQTLPSIEEKDVELQRFEYMSSSEAETVGTGGGESSSSGSPSRTEQMDRDSTLLKEYYPPFPQQRPRELVLDPSGLPLSPQPLEDERDPLTWPFRRKLGILIQVALMSFLAQFLANDISAALWPLHTYFNVSFNKVSYVVGTYILSVGVGPFLWNPLAHRFGRRPMFIAAMAGMVFTSAGSGLSRQYPTILTLRSLSGLFAAIPIGLGSVVVCDLFYAHQRGLYMGIYMVFLVTGGHLGPVIGGYIYKGMNWHWCFFLVTIMAGILFFTVIFTVPETLYFRAIEGINRPSMSLYQQEYLRKRKIDGQRLHLEHFIRPFKMLRYPSIALPSLYYSVASGYANMVFIITSAMLFHIFYKFNSYQTGLLMGVPLTLGSWFGEFGAGGFSDWVTERKAIRRGGKRIPEDRLFAMLPGVILAPLGLTIEGFCFQHRYHWIGAGLGIATASAGFQIITTVTYAYTAEVSLSTF